MTEEEIQQLVAYEAFYEQQETVTKEATIAALLALWVGLGSWRDRDIENLTPEYVRLWKLGATQIGNLTLSRVNTLRRLQGIPVDSEFTVSSLNLSPGKLYKITDQTFVKRFANNLYSRLSDGESFDNAFSKATVRVESVTDKSLQDATFEVQKSVSPPPGKTARYVRVLGSGVRNHCEDCVKDCLVYYKSPKSIGTLHNRCSCSYREVWVDDPKLYTLQPNLSDSDRRLLEV